MNELHGLAVEPDAFDLQESRQLKQQRPRTSFSYIKLRAGSCMNLFGRLHLGRDGITANFHSALARTLAFTRRGLVARGVRSRRSSGRKRCPDVIIMITILSRFRLSGLYLLGRRGIEVDIENAKLGSL